MKSIVAPNFYGTRASCEGVGFTLSESVYPASFKMPRHEHEAAYFSLLLKGAYTETDWKGTRTCSPSTMVFHPPHERHAVDFHDAEVRIFRAEIKSRWIASAEGCRNVRRIFTAVWSLRFALDSMESFNEAMTARRSPSKA